MSVPVHWARSGAMWLTGRPDGPPLPVRGAPADVVARDLAAIATHPSAAGAAVPGVGVLGERAAYTGGTRQGDRSVGGACRMLPASDGWIAVSLARPSDVDLLAALTEAVVDDPWRDLAEWLDRTSSATVAVRAALLSLPLAVVPERPPPVRRPGIVATPGGPVREHHRPRVVDLSALWAGPLCAHLLGLLGADVVKVESTDRPDGARRGEPRFYDVLHAGHRSATLDFTTDGGRAALRRLLADADVVIEASRPRALRALGVDAERYVVGGAVWVSITAYGRDDDALRVGFGDDVAAGAGLVAEDGGTPLFAGDALADPLTGVAAAAATLRALDGATGALLDVSMHDLARAAALATPETGEAVVTRPTVRS